MLLDKIKGVGDIKKINPQDYPELAQEIRYFLIEKISKAGGHLGSNLGAVELTMALHLSLNLPKDKVIFDVGHQSSPNGRKATATVLTQDTAPLLFQQAWDL